MCGKIAVFVGIAFLAFSAIKFTNAGVMTMKRDPTAEPGTCIFRGKDEDFIMDFDVSMSVPNRCQRALCKRDGSIELATCGTMSINSKKCKVVENFILPYPGCCTEVICGTIGGIWLL